MAFLPGQMQNAPLLISSLIEHADRHHGDTEIVSKRVEGDLHRTTWRGIHQRSRRMANALRDIGVEPGERVGTLAWNGYRHLEVYFAVSGSGMVLHTINPRLHPEQIVWIINHADDRVIYFDLTFLPIISAIAKHCPRVKRWVVMIDTAMVPADTGIADFIGFEQLIEDQSDTFEWPSFDENTASSLCYTSGTTGNPKGALYSHRSTVLHAFAAAMPDAMCLSQRDAILPVVPMFHVNAWGIPYSAAAVGAKLVFPGKDLDGASLFALLEGEEVTFSAGVPTVWLGLLNHVQAQDARFTTLNRTVIGGSACPPAMIRRFEDQYGVRVIHAWGMTEMSPLGTACQLRNKHSHLPLDEQQKIQLKQGKALYGVDMKIINDDGQDLPWDGATPGHLLVRGPWVIENYFKGEGGSPLIKDARGVSWFPTGDVATIDAEGYLQITDRSKDVIKSGGEWISTIDLENIAMAHPAVQLAAAIACRHPKWDERPLLVVTLKPGASVTRDELIAFYEGKIAKWWTPDDVAFVTEIPLGATGKVQKRQLRDQFADYVLPTIN